MFYIERVTSDRDFPYCKEMRKQSEGGDSLIVLQCESECQSEEIEDIYIYIWCAKKVFR